MMLDCAREFCTAGLLRLALCGMFFFVAARAAQDEVPLRLVDMHTAGVLPKGQYQSEIRMYPGMHGAGLLMDFSVGLSDRFSIGLGYGGEGIVGRERHAVFNPFPGCLIKYRIFEENYAFPGMAIGYDYQGFGGIADPGLFGYKGYIFKSPGFFFSVSKSYLFLGAMQLGMHGAMSVSMEDFESAGWPNAMIGMDAGFNEELVVVAEYDFGLATKDPVRSSRSAPYARPQDGYFHAGIRWAAFPKFVIEFDVRDIAENRRYRVGPSEYRALRWSREIKVGYRGIIR